MLREPESPSTESKSETPHLPPNIAFGTCRFYKNLKQHEHPAVKFRISKDEKDLLKKMCADMGSSTTTETPRRTSGTCTRWSRFATPCASSTSSRGSCPRCATSTSGTPSTSTPLRADRTNDAEITEYFASTFGFRVVFAVDNFAN